MIQTVEAVIDERGSVRLLQPVEISGSHRALVTILDEQPVASGHEAASPSESALANDWNRPEENAAMNEVEKLEQRRKAVASVRAFREKMRLKYGVQPDSTLIIREARDNPRA